MGSGEMTEPASGWSGALGKGESVGALGRTGGDGMAWKCAQRQEYRRAVEVSAMA